MDTTLTPPRTQYSATHGKTERRNQFRYPGLASSVHTPTTPRLSPVMSRSAIRVCSKRFTATVLIRNGQTYAPDPPKPA